MAKWVAAGLAATLLVALAEPAAATSGGDLTQQFYDACIHNTPDTKLCRCKANAAPKLIGRRMEGYVIAAMKGSRDTPPDVLAKWNEYMVRSDRICKPGY